MRGQRNFNNLFVSEYKNKQPFVINGRSKELIDKRNTALFHRYYFFSTHTSNRYEVVIKRLQEEFYLSNVRIAKIISANLQLVSQIKKEKPTIKNLEKQHPHFNWRVDNSLI